MRKLAVTASILLAAAGITVVGLFGAYGYGRDYYLHRGFAALVQLPRAGTGRLLAVNYYSTALHRRADYMVYLPPGYSSQRRYPVYYLLHGMPGQPKVFVDIANMDVRLDNQLALGHARPMILVYPDGRIGGSVLSDSEWANTPSGNYESYVIEVMHNVDQRFSTLASPPGPRDRGLFGRRLRRAQHRAAPPLGFRQRAVVVGLFHADTHRRVRCRRSGNARVQQPPATGLRSSGAP